MTENQQKHETRPRLGKEQRQNQTFSGVRGDGVSQWEGSQVENRQDQKGGGGAEREKKDRSAVR